MLMLAIVYWAGASTFLIDKSVLDLTPAAAIAISIASLVAAATSATTCCAASSSRSPRCCGRRSARFCCSPTGRCSTCSADARRTSTSARSSARSWSRTSRTSSSPGSADARADSRRAGARSAAGPARQDALGAQHLPHAAGAVHHDQQPLSDDVRRGATAGSCSRASARRACWCGGSSCCRTSSATSSACRSPRRCCSPRVAFAIAPRPQAAAARRGRRDRRGAGLCGRRADRREALRRVPRRAPDAAGLHRRAAGRAARHAGAACARTPRASTRKPSRRTRCRSATSPT